MSTIATLSNERLYRGYSGAHDVRRTDPSQNYEFWFDRPRDGQILGLRNASIRAAQEFHQRFPNKEIIILYSGGMDSEWLCESFYLAKVPFTPLIVSYGEDNAHDLWWARRYLERRQITNAIWWELDLRKWYGSAEQWEIGANAQISELAYAGQFKAMLEHQSADRVFLNGYDEPVITADDSGAVREWNLIYNERHYAIHKFMAAYGFLTQPGGWVDANVFAAYVNCPMWQMLVSNMIMPQVWNSELVKAKIYQTAFPFMETRPKYTGFERMLDVVVPETKRWRAHTKEQWGTEWLQDWSRDIKSVWRELKGE